MALCYCKSVKPFAAFVHQPVILWELGVADCGIQGCDCFLVGALSYLEQPRNGPRTRDGLITWYEL